MKFKNKKFFSFNLKIFFFNEILVMFNSVSTYFLFAYEILNDCFNSVFNNNLNEISFYEFFFMEFHFFFVDE